MIFIIVLLPLIGLFFYPHLPEVMGTHWGWGNKPDDYMGKFAGTFMAALVLMIVTTSLLALNLLFTNIFAKAYRSDKPTLIVDCFTVLFSLFLLTAYIALLVWNAGVDFSMPRFMNISGIALIAASLGATIFIFLKKSKIPEKQTEEQAHCDPLKNEYRDSLVEIADNTIVFKNYYFPAGSKTIRLTDVDYVEEKKLTFWNGKWRLHGTGDFRTWFPADYARPSRDKIFTMKVKDKWMRIGFTVTDSKAVSQIFRNKGLIK